MERMNLNATKRSWVRLKKRMNWALRSLLVFVLTGALATSALACPLWMESTSRQGMPCSDQANPGGRCPVSVCQLSSPYLASHVSVDVAPLQELPIESLDCASLGSAFTNADSLRRDDPAPGGPSGELYLQFHSLLI